MLRRPLLDEFYHENKWFLDCPKIFSLLQAVENQCVTSVCDKRFQEMCLLSLFILRFQPLRLNRNFIILLHIYFYSKLPHKISLSPAISRNGISFKNYSRYLPSHQKTILEILYTVFSHGRMYRLRNIFHTFRVRVISVLIALKRVFRKLESAGTRCVIFTIMEVQTGNHY